MDPNKFWLLNLWMVVVTPAERPKSVHNRCVIEVFWQRFSVVNWLFKIPVGKFGLCPRTESDFFLFRSSVILWQNNKILILHTHLLSLSREETQFQPKWRHTNRMLCWPVPYWTFCPRFRLWSLVWLDSAPSGRDVSPSSPGCKHVGLLFFSLWLQWIEFIFIII